MLINVCPLIQFSHFEVLSKSAVQCENECFVTMMRKYDLNEKVEATFYLRFLYRSCMIALVVSFFYARKFSKLSPQFSKLTETY